MLVRCTATLLSWQSELWVGFDSGKRNRDIPVHSLHSNIRPSMSLTLTLVQSATPLPSFLDLYDKKIAWAVWTSFPDLTVTLGALMCSPSVFSLQSFLMQRFESFVVLVYNEGCGAPGVKEARLRLFISGTKWIESIQSTQVSDTTIWLLTATKPHRCCRKSQISWDGANTRMARVHGICCGSRQGMHRNIAIVQRPLNSTLKMRRRIL